jgi:plasmid stabilization system protein ParE
MMTHPSEPPTNIVPLRGGTEVQQQVALPGMRSENRPRQLVVKSKTPPVVATSDGHTAQSIIAHFSKYLEEKTEVRVPTPILARLGKQVKVLILDKYERATIVWALAIWTHRAATATTPPQPEQLVQIAWKYAMDGSAAAARWRDQMKTAIQMNQSTRAVGNDVASDVHETRSDVRRRRTAQGGAAWMARQQGQPE